MLGRGTCGDDIEELSGVPMSTVYSIFHKFIEKFSTIFYEKFVYFPSGDELKKVLAVLTLSKLRPFYLSVVLLSPFSTIKL